MTTRVVGVACALRSEARHLGPTVFADAAVHVLTDGTRVAVTGMGCAAARAGAQRLVKAGAGALVSFGMAGGLDPQLAAGRIFLPQKVASEGGRVLDCDPTWRERLGAALAVQAPLTLGTLLTSRGAVASVAAKAALFGGTGARAVDMESLAIAEVAHDAGLPFIALRVIIDRAEDALPGAVLAATGADGEVSPGRLIVQLARRPLQLASLLRLARAYHAARRALAAVAASGALALPPPAGSAAYPARRELP